MENHDIITHEINITDGTLKQARTGRLLFLVFPMVMIGIGILTGSGAMQWMGFVLSFFVIFAYANSLLGKNNRLTIDQARKRLDEIEAGQ